MPNERWGIVWYERDSDQEPNPLTAGIYDENEDLIAEVVSFPTRKQAERNAQLMAAAPELIEALRNLLEAVAPYVAGEGAAKFDAIRAGHIAIGRAEGRDDI